MPRRDPRVDRYIADAAEFARPVLKHLRRLVHGACPGVEETIKWNFPHFVYKGNLCYMAAFKAHCAFGFWKHRLLFNAPRPQTAMGEFGRIEKRSDLPSDKFLIACVKKAANLNEINETGAKCLPNRKLHFK